MKKSAFLAVLFVAVAAGAAPLPQRMNYQGKLLDRTNNDNPYNGTVGLTFNIYDAASGGNVLWGPETQSVTVTNGVFSAQLGANVALSTRPFSGATAYLGVAAGADPEMTPRQRLVMSPYAFTAAQVVNDDGVRLNSGASDATFTSEGNLLVPYGVESATGAFTATGAAQYSLTTSSGINMQAGELNVAGFVGMGLIYNRYSANNATLRCACTQAQTKAMAGACNSSNRTVTGFYPSTESTDSAGTAGTAVADGGVAAYSWTCRFSGANASNTCFVICARIAN